MLITPARPPVQATLTTGCPRCCCATWSVAPPGFGWWRLARITSAWAPTTSCTRQGGIGQATRAGRLRHLQPGRQGSGRRLRAGTLTSLPTSQARTTNHPYPPPPTPPHPIPHAPIPTHTHTHPHLHEPTPTHTPPHTHTSTPLYITCRLAPVTSPASPRGHTPSPTTQQPARRCCASRAACAAGVSDGQGAGHPRA